ncbi:MAG: archaeosortase/exosortase family protein [Thermodesulfobacteriota bacterium]
MSGWPRLTSALEHLEGEASRLRRTEPALIALLLLTFLPVWKWYFLRLADGSDEPWGLVALGTALVLSISVHPEEEDSPQRRREHREYEEKSASLSCNSVPFPFNSVEKHNSFNFFSLSSLRPLCLCGELLRLSGTLLLTAMWVMLYAVVYPFGPRLLLAACAMGALGCMLSALRWGSGCYFPLMGLLVLSLPVVSSLQFFLGYPLRLVSGFVSVLLLRCQGLDVVQEGTLLKWDSAIISIDAPCSGIKMLWAGLYLALVGSALFGLRNGKTLAALVCAAVLVVLGNGVRSAALFHTERLGAPTNNRFDLSRPAWSPMAGRAGSTHVQTADGQRGGTVIRPVAEADSDIRSSRQAKDLKDGRADAGLVSIPEWSHEGVGLVVFAAAAVLIMLLCRRLAGRVSSTPPACSDERVLSSSHPVSAERRAGGLMRHAGFLVTSCMVAALVPLMCAMQQDRSAPFRFDPPVALDWFVRSPPQGDGRTGPYPGDGLQAPAEERSRSSDVPGSSDTRPSGVSPVTQVPAAFLGLTGQELFPGSTLDPVGSGAREVPLSREEQLFRKDFPGSVSKFRVGDRSVVVRWVTVPTRKLHPASDCYRGEGYAVKPLSMEQDSQGRGWGRFRAARNGQVVIVRERIFDSHGGNWTDVSSWFWSAILGRTQSPWWAITVAESQELAH